MPVRPATPKDFDAILDMAAEFWNHTQFTEPFDYCHTYDMVQMSYDHGLLIVVDDGGVCGFMAAIKSPLLASAYATMATELAFWINPDKRGRMFAIQLVELLESLCIDQDVKYLSLAFMETSMPAKVKKLYESLGYTLQETVYTKVLNGGNHSRRSHGRRGPLRGAQSAG